MNDEVEKVFSRVDALVELLATSQISLETLSPEDRALVARSHLFDTLKAKLARRVELYGLVWSGLAEAWLMDGGRAVKTVTEYRRALGKFNLWCGENKVHPLELTKSQADNFILSLRDSGKSAVWTVRNTADWISSLYSWIGRRHPAIRNPFRGTRAKPRARVENKSRIPTEADLDVILNALRPLDALAIEVMARLGLAVGSLPTLVFSGLGGRFWTVFKGCEIVGVVPPSVVARLKASGVEDFHSPFSGTTGQKLVARLRALLAALHEKGLVSRGYSTRDFVHFYAVHEYPRSRDLYALRLRLGHSTVLVTEKYLARLGL